MTYTVCSTALVSADNNGCIGDQRIAVETGLVTVLVDVVTPTHLSRLLLEGIEGAGTRSDQ